MSKKYSRREMLGRTGGALLISALGVPGCFAAQKKSGGRWEHGAVVAETEGARVGLKILAEGGNAIDSAVAAALTGCIAAPARSGIGGYGGHMIIALAGGKKITAIDFNSTAPAAARPDMFPLDEKGAVRGRVNFFGWQAAGVPGTLAGLQLALGRYGTRTFRELVQPAIRLAEEGIVISKVFGSTLRTCSSRFAQDAGSAKIYLKDGRPLKEGEILRNPELAKLLSRLAKENSVDSFYRGADAQIIAEAFQSHGGLVTAKDLAAYHAREVEPLRLPLNGFEIHTAPLTAGGLTILEALSILKALDWKEMPSDGAGAHARLEALRLAWKDRLTLLGDPEQTKVPVERLLSIEYARELEAEVRTAVTEKKPVSTGLEKHLDEGTNNICTADRHGNMVAVTLTHGGSFGAQVTVDGLGLTLGHGMSRFEPRPGHPNSPGPGKRPLHNMCPTVVLRNGLPVLAIGGAGGTRIPNAIFDALTEYVLRDASMDLAVAAPRLHCTGTLEAAVEPAWPKADSQYLKQIGFKVSTGESPCVVSAVSINPKNGECKGALRGPPILGLNLGD
jgi:gamma-glutamyltranspeptidase/glutathione hydrolase